MTAAMRRPQWRGQERISHNTWMHRGVRLLVRPLVETPVTPNQLTALRLAAGLGAAAALAVGDPFWRQIGAAVFVLAFLLDRADGELARLGGKTTPWGHTFDLIADGVCDVLIFVGLGIGLRDGAYGPWAIPMGILAGGAVASIFWLVMRIEATKGQRAAELPSAAGFDPDDAILLVPIAIWLGGAETLLAAAAVGAPAFAIFFFFWFLRLRAANPQQTPQGPQEINRRPDAGGNEERS